MVEVYTTLQVNRKQAAVLSSIGFDSEEFEENLKFIGGVSLENSERDIIEKELESKGFLVKVGDVFKLTPEGKDLQTRIDIAFFKED